ncbi:hypothetical protein ACRE_089570 [Hapsidospora chrysogenum ATCC 11550]|uniref:Uncharacterized protein n=1 Tax=Hapsidospora chrysogenum (strain ATCC 11550 / CBS 779.69 / DSM 880 / IAM 14645 / JCM 23072 / IMI 49137) TaxID=857340 RepID=A0A086STE7_HAPC1|nr:hypothetical protein ACRE_089570 [Hapsidospora chrysogenum ATCC 11550]
MAKPKAQDQKQSADTQQDSGKTHNAGSLTKISPSYQLLTACPLDQDLSRAHTGGRVLFFNHGNNEYYMPGYWGSTCNGKTSKLDILEQESEEVRDNDQNRLRGHQPVLEPSLRRRHLQKQEVSHCETFLEKLLKDHNWLDSSDITAMLTVFLGDMEDMVYVAPAHFTFRGPYLRLFPGGTPWNKHQEVYDCGLTTRPLTMSRNTYFRRCFGRRFMVGVSWEGMHWTGWIWDRRDQTLFILDSFKANREKRSWALVTAFRFALRCWGITSPFSYVVVPGTAQQGSTCGFVIVYWITSLLRSWTGFTPAQLVDKVHEFQVGTIKPLPDQEANPHEHRTRRSGKTRSLQPKKSLKDRGIRLHDWAYHVCREDATKAMDAWLILCPFDSGFDDGDDGFETYELIGAGPNAVPDTDTSNQVSTIIDYQAGIADDEIDDHDNSDASSSTLGRIGRPGGGEPLWGGPPRGGPPWGRLLTGSDLFDLEEDDGGDCEINGAKDYRYDNVSDSEDEPKWALEYYRTFCRLD